MTGRRRVVNGRRAGRVSRPGGPGLPTVVRMRTPTPAGGPERLVTLADSVFAIAITCSSLIPVKVWPGRREAAASG